PRGGTGPRINHVRAAARTARLPNVLLSWVGADGFPVVVPVGVRGTDQGGIVLDAPAASVPPGGRRAGLTAHWFSRNVIGQHQRVHTGWLESDGGGRAVYAPHTDASYRFPPSLLLYRLVAGAGTRWRLRQARRAGVLPGGGLTAAVAGAVAVRVGAGLRPRDVEGEDPQGTVVAAGARQLAAQAILERPAVEHPGQGVGAGQTLHGPDGPLAPPPARRRHDRGGAQHHRQRPQAGEGEPELGGNRVDDPGQRRLALRSRRGGGSLRRGRA